MKNAHYISIRVFVKPNEDLEQIKKTLFELSGTKQDLFEKNNIYLTQEIVEGFNQKNITKLTLQIEKNKLINNFFQKLNDKLTNNELQALRKQENRLDTDMNFYLRLNKEELLKNNYKLTDKGNCYHVRVNLATYPKKKIKALEIINRIIKEV